jgi:hypothetical protein
MPPDPRQAVGACASLAAEYNVPSASAGIATFGAYQPWQTGAATAVSVNVNGANVWPPASITQVSGPVANLPQLTPTGTPIVLAVESGDSYTATPTANNWFATVPACSYTDAWSGVRFRFVHLIAQGC